MTCTRENRSELSSESGLFAYEKYFNLIKFIYLKKKTMRKSKLNLPKTKANRISYLVLIEDFYFNLFSLTVVYLNSFSLWML